MFRSQMLNKWAFTDTMLSLSHPERTLIPKLAIDAARRREADLMRNLAETYEQMDEEEELFWSRHYSGEFCTARNFAF